MLSNSSLKIEISATTDAETLCSFAHHSYFNLKGGGTIEGHELQIEADHYIDVDSQGIPLDLCNVNKSPFDFRVKKKLSSSEALDHNFCISNYRTKIKNVAKLSYDSVSMDLMSSEPGLQVYTGHKLGVALEPQLWPDAPNNEFYPSALLGPNEKYLQETILRFSDENL